MADRKEYERHTDEWHEWSIDVTDPQRAGRLAPLAQRLFVRIDGVFTITEAYVTSGNPEAREVDGGEIVELTLTGEQAKWLRDTLTKALVQRGDEEPSTPFKDAVVALAKERAVLLMGGMMIHPNELFQLAGVTPPGRVRCERCSGTGSILSERTLSGEERCGICSGTGSLPSPEKPSP